jgi:hypothetical protein
VQSTFGAGLPAAKTAGEIENANAVAKITNAFILCSKNM